jgi:hypothetical protein
MALREVLIPAEVGDDNFAIVTAEDAEILRERGKQIWVALPA